MRLGSSLRDPHSVQGVSKILGRLRGLSGSRFVILRASMLFRSNA